MPSGTQLLQYLVATRMHTGVSGVLRGIRKVGRLMSGTVNAP